MAYVRAARPLYVETPLWGDQKKPLVPAISVDEQRAVRTGLLWPDGSPIMRTPNPIGFGRDREW
jgi:hypothetical protein